MIELLVVIAIIGALVALVIPAVQQARAAARRAQCMSNVRQVGMGIQTHHSAVGHYPSGKFLGEFGAGPYSRAWSWMAVLLPYVEQDTLYTTGRIDVSTLAESKIAGTKVSLFLCPSDGFSQIGPRLDAGNLTDFPVGHTNFKAVSGANWGHDWSQGLSDIGTAWPNRGTNGSYDGQDNGDGIMLRSDFRLPRREAMVTDGLSNTLMIGEVLASKDRWTSWPYANNAYATCAIPLNLSPRGDASYDPLWWPNVLSYRSAHVGVVSFCLADGSVRQISDSVSLEVYRSLATIQGGETTGE